MGWSYQHDFKVKKLWKLFISGVILILLTSCSFRNDVNPDEKQANIREYDSKKIVVRNEGPVYVANWNDITRYVDINSFSISKIKERTAEEQEVIDITKKSLSNDTAYVYVNRLNEKVSNQIKKINSRGGELKIPTTLRENTTELGDKKEFYTWFVENGNDFYKTEEAECKYVGDHCVVWYVEDPLIAVTDADCIKLGEKFDTIYEMETNLISTNKYKYKIDDDYIDPQDKIDILFMDLWYDHSDTNTVLGYFSSSDIITQDYFYSYYGDNYNKKVNGGSNESQMLYLDSYYYLLSPDTIYSTITHEFNHLLNFCYKTVYLGRQVSRWYTEMLAMLVEDAFQKYLGISDIDSSKARLITYAMDYGYCYSPFDWFDVSSEIDMVGYSYAKTYGLGAFLVRNFGGLELLHEIASNEATNEYSIELALSKLGYSFEYESKTKNDPYPNLHYAMFQEPYGLINIRAKQNEDLSKINKENEVQYHTFNRTWVSSSFPGLSFDAIPIIGSYDLILNNEVVKYNYYPILFDPNIKYRGNIGRYGFALFDIGSNLKSFKVNLTDSYKGFYDVLFEE